MIQHLFIQILHELCIVICIALIAGHMVQYGRCIDCFSKCPVHTVVYDRLSIPVCCIDNARCTVGIPSVRHSTVIQVLRNRQVFFCRLRIIRIGRKRPLCDQPRPLDAVSRRCAIWLKRVVRLVLVAVQLGCPFLCKVFRNPPLVGFCPAFYMIDDPSGSHTVLLLFRHICRCEKCLYRMHVCIQSAIIIKHGELCIPGIAG